MKRIIFLIIGLILVKGTVVSQTGGKGPLTWSIVASYNIPGKASGLAWDGTYIYFGIYGTNGDQVYKFNPSNGSYVLQCSGPFDDAYGLTYKGPNLVTIKQPTSSSQPSLALEFTFAGAQVSTLILPDHYMSGIAWDNGNYWVCTYYPDPGTVYHINGTGTVLSQFTPPNTQPWDICIQGSDLWIADYYANMLYKVTTSGTVLESHACQTQKPSGIVYDGTYLWYCDGQLGQNSTLYKVDLLGTGTPVITVPVTSHDYGAVAIGSSATWNCQVQNTGTANLTITGVSVPSGQPITTSFTVPQTIIPGGSANIPLIFAPVSPIPLNTQITILSNDPIHPQVDVTLTGNGVYAGPHIQVGEASHDWQERRKGAYSRWFLSLTNDGNQPLIITEIATTDDHFIVDASITFPVTVDPLEEALFGIWFHPEEGIYYSGEAVIQSNSSGQNPLEVFLEGTGEDTLYPMGTVLWSTMINTSYDNSPKAIASIQDITGDNIDDVLVGTEDDYIRCFNGNASVTADVLWETEIYAGSVYRQNCLASISDINTDGFDDVVVGSAWGDRSIIALSGKTGEQLWKHDTHEYGDGGWVYQVFTETDYNNDGFPDILACTGNDQNNTGPKRVYCLNGKNGTSIWETVTDGPVFSVTGAEDFTGDGKPDVIAGGSNQQETTGRVYGISGTDGDIKWTYYTNGSSVWALMQIDDLNNDGKKDIAAGDFNGMVLFLSAANGSLIHYMTIGNVLILQFENMGDVNKDGHPDILVAHSGTQGIIVNGFTCTALWQTSLADKPWCVGNIGDITWDGINDAIIGTLYQDNYVYFLDGWDGTELKSINTTTAVDALHAIPDIVGDNTKEMVMGGRNGMVVCMSGGYDPSVGFSETETTPGEQGTMRVYPNPCDGIIHLVMDLEKASHLQIVCRDLSGNVIYSGQYDEKLPGVKQYIMPLRDTFTGGICIVEAKTNTGIYREKVIIIR